VLEGHVAELHEAIANQCGDFEEGEEAVFYNVQVTRKEALEGPHRIQWMEASSVEKLGLESKTCWRAVENGELRRDDEVIPTVIIFTRKRCGRFK